MEIDKENFKQQLLPILQYIANATYVAIDLEMSGISKRARSTNALKPNDFGRPSLQQLYEENRQAAESYQILQVEFYLARPFNFHLSPLSADGLDIKLNRDFGFSSSACDFLKGCGFDFGKVFSSGVPYLSMQEEYDLKDEFEKTAERNKKIPDLVIPTEDVTNLRFYKDSREKIDDWVKDTKPNKDLFLNISCEDGGSLSGYQRRLIYQLVRAEFPGLQVSNRNNGDFMQVERYNDRKETERQRRNLDRFNAQVAKQKGLRWIYEALTNGDLEGINPSWFCDPSSEDPETQHLLKVQELAAVKEKLRTKNHVLVGHNLFTDLIFLQKTFVGSLPLTVKHFQEDIHEVFPLIIDTKFLGTQADRQFRSSLKELLQPFKRVHVPLILLDEQHTAYGTTHGKEHEAGYDSWMTAELFVKLSVKLYLQQNPTQTKGSTILGSSENNQDRNTSIEETASVSSDEDSSAGYSSISGGVKLIQSPTSNPFKSIPSSRLEKARLPGEWHSRELNMPVNEPVEPRQWLPGFEDDFWDKYANKLRVNASDAGVCDLEEGP